MTAIADIKTYINNLNIWFSILQKLTQPGYSGSFNQSPLSSNKSFPESLVIKCERRAAEAPAVLPVTLHDLKEYNLKVSLKF